MKIRIIGQMNYYQLTEIKEIINHQRTTDRVYESTTIGYQGSDGNYDINIKCNKYKSITSITVRVK